MSSDAEDAFASIDGVYNRLQALEAALSDLRDELEAERERREKLEAETERRQHRIDELEQRVDEIDARTDLLDLVKHSDDAEAPQRRVALIMHLKRKAEDRSDDEPAVASVDRKQAADALHYPDIDRTTYYDDMRNAADLVEDDRVLAYSDGELVLDLEAGAIPGQEVLRQRASEGSR